MRNIAARFRPVLAVVIVVGLLLGLGIIAFDAQRSSTRTAEQVHRNDRIQLQQTLAGLTRQYLLLSLGELNALAGQGGWQLTGSSVADEQRLRMYVDSSPLIGAGAQTVGLDGRPLTAFSAAGYTLPPAIDPGFQPLRAALLAGQPGVSAVMAVGGHDLIAFGVPIRVGGIPRALVIGFVDARTWPLQTYVSHLTLGNQASPYVVDAAGVAAAAPDPQQVGQRVAGLPNTAPTATVLQKYTSGGQSVVDTRGPVELAGWQSVTVQPATAYDGDFARQHSEALLALLALLLTACMLTVGAFVGRYRRLAREARRGMFDPLTGLAQRHLLTERMDAALARARRTGTPLTVCYGDLNGFKAINDSHGHRRGDAVLVEIARRLQHAVRAQDLVARLGGDEFVVVAEDLAGLEAAAVLAERIIAGVNESLELDRGTVHVGISLGIIHTSHGDSHTVLEAADTAMYDAKHSGRPFVIRHLGALAHLSAGTSLSTLRDDRPDPAVRP